MFLYRILPSVRRRGLTVCLITLLLVAISGNGSTAFADPVDPELPPGQPSDPLPDKPKHPRLDSSLNKMVEQIGSLRTQNIASSAPVSIGDLVAVTVRLSHNSSSTAEFLKSVGAIVANIGADYIEAYIPVTVLAPLSERDGVLRIQAITPPTPTVTSQGTTIHRSPIWNTRGYTGDGIKVGVIDSGFTGYSALMGSELPSAVVARCYTAVGFFSSNPSSCEAGSVHGTAVAEAIVDIAPDVTLYIANPLSKGDLQSTAAWMVSEGVQVINMSLKWRWDGPGDGTSSYAESPLNTVDSAVAGGVVWVTAAGNDGDAVNWYGAYSDANADGWLEFTSSWDHNPIWLSAGSSITVHLRWDDSWGSASSDLDLFLYDYNHGWILLYGSYDFQDGGAGQDPYETFTYSVLSTGWHYLRVKHFEGVAPEWFQLMVWSGQDLDVSVPDHSISNPGDSSNPGMLTVGAANWATPGTIESFSSRGPTTDGRIKPDIVGADRGDSVSYGANGFDGTSQASPHVAGLAALVLQRYPEYTPGQVATYLKNNALGMDTVPNNTWGYGLAQMPLFEPTAPIDVNATSGAGQATVTWSAPASDGGSTVTQYTVTSDPGELTVTARGFDAGLKTITGFGAGDDKSYAMATLDDGKILVGGYVYNGTDDDFALARYDSDGTLDTTFGSSGRTITDFGYGLDHIRALTVLNSGGILAGGYADNGTDYDFGLTRYNSDGNLDTTFGSGGKTTTDFGYGTDVIYAMTVLDSGKILVGGYADNGTDYDFALTRYSSDGNLDTTFGSGGKTTTDFGYGTDVIVAMTVLDSGKILVGGYADNGTDDDFALARYDADGSLDTSFGSGGKTTTDFSDSTDKIFEVAVRGDGKLIVAGYAHNGSDYDFALARYNQDGGLDPGLTSVVTGLTNGTAYTFTVTATNSIGTSATSDASNSVTPAGSVAAQTQAVDIRLSPEFTTIPSGGSVDLTIDVVPNGQQLNGIDVCISFPAYLLQVVDADSGTAGVQIQIDTSGLDVILQNNVDNPGGVISYSAGKISGSLPSSTFTLATVSMVAANVDNTATVRFSTTACPASPNNVVLGDTTVLGGTSDSSIVIGTGVPAVVPGAPREVIGTSGNSQAIVSWTPPASDGDSMITEYTVISSPGGVTATTTDTSVTVTGLTNGTAYTFTVTATNSVGTGPPSEASTSVTPATVPGVPREVSASPGDRQAVVTWIPPASDGGSAITEYTVISSPGGVTATTTGTSATVSSLTTGTIYSFTVTAKNSVGTSGISTASNVVTAGPSPPVAYSQEASTTAGVPVTITLTGSDTDWDTIGWAIVNPVNGGTIQYIPKSRTTTTIDILFTPNSGFTGTAGFKFYATDASSASNTAAVTINVSPAALPTPAPASAVATPTPIPNVWNAPSTSSWSLVALVVGMLVVMVIGLRLTSGVRRASRP